MDKANGELTNHSTNMTTNDDLIERTNSTNLLQAAALNVNMHNSNLQLRDGVLQEYNTDLDDNESKIRSDVNMEKENHGLINIKGKFNQKGKQLIDKPANQSKESVILRTSKNNKQAAGTMIARAFKAFRFRKMMELRIKNRDKIK